MITSACFRGLSDSLHAALDTGNREEVRLVLEDAEHYFNGECLTIVQLADLYADARDAGYEF